MSEFLALAILGAWMWREREHSRDVRALLEKVAGVSIEPPAAVTSPRRKYGDAAEYEIEQERLNL